MASRTETKDKKAKPVKVTAEDLGAISKKTETRKISDKAERKNSGDYGRGTRQSSLKTAPNAYGTSYGEKINESDTPRTLHAVLEASKVNFQKGMKSFLNPPGSSLDDFQREVVLGRGGFGVVVSVTHTKTNESYAMKMLSKRMVVQQRQLDRSLGEKRLLQAVNFPFLVSLVYFFVDRSYLYFLLPLAKRGDMYNYLRQSKRFSIHLARFYAAQVVMALEYLHCIEIAFRDLKPENIVIFINGYIKLTDFGCSKIITGRTYTMCGTPEYMAPEILKNVGYNRSVDWWAFGVLVYEMMAGFSPFEGDSTKQTYEKILLCKIKYPSAMPPEGRNLIKRLVEPDLTRRFGNLHKGAADVKQHNWFDGCDWNGIFQQKVMPPAIPSEKQWLKMTEPYNPKEFKISSVSHYRAEFAEFN